MQQRSDREDKPPLVTGDVLVQTGVPLTTASTLNVNVDTLTLTGALTVAGEPMRNYCPDRSEYSIELIDRVTSRRYSAVMQGDATGQYALRAPTALSRG